jgi:putative MATE family efflux protein
MSYSKDVLLERLRDGDNLDFKDLLKLTIVLSIPAILAELSGIVMHYIDAAMVGSLGASASASIGLISTTTWIFYGVCFALTMGFSVQVAHHIGAKRNDLARDTLRKSLTFVVAVSLVLLIIGIGISPYLPFWLGGDESIAKDATLFFFIFSLRMPLMQLRFHASSMLRCSGNMRSPSILNIGMCLLDVIFNYFLIFGNRTYDFLGLSFTMPGFGLGVMGAAIGTLMAEGIVAIMLMHTLLCKSKELALNLDTDIKGIEHYIPTIDCIKKALKIALPMGVENITICGAQIVTTIIVAPLGMIAIAANSFGIIVESLCYMPGYGIADAATTLVGQSLGAKRHDLTKRLAWMTVCTGMVVMSITAVVMYIIAPYIMAMMTPDSAVREQATMALRIECFAEPMYAASIVAYGVFVGACDTLIPAIMNLGSIWIVRISLAFALAPSMGLKGVWMAMCIELIFRGCIFLGRLYNGAWLKKFAVKQ